MTVEITVEVTIEVEGATGYFDEQKEVAGANVDKGRNRLYGALEQTLAGAAEALPMRIRGKSVVSNIVLVYLSSECSSLKRREAQCR